MFCVNCGKEIPENARFCNNCGADQGEPAPSPDFQEPLRHPKGDQTATPPAVQAHGTGMLRIGGILLAVLSVLSFAVCAMLHQYQHFTVFVSANDVLHLLTQGCAFLAGITMCFMATPKKALKLGGVAALALSTLSVLLCLFGGIYIRFFSSIQNYVSEGVVVSGGIELLLIQCGMIIAGILMLRSGKRVGQ